MEYLLITEDLVDKIVCASYGHDMELNLEVLKPEELPVNKQWEYGFITEEEYMQIS